MVSIADLKTRFKGSLALNVPMERFASLEVGGPSDFLFEPANAEDALMIISEFHNRSIPMMLVAKGSRILVHDDGFHGAAISLERGCAFVHLQSAIGDERIVVAGSGARLAKLIAFCTNHGIGGVQELSGIHGTVGGGFISGVLADRVIDIVAVDTAGTRTILSVMLRLHAAPPQELHQIQRESLVRNNTNVPINIPRSSVVFRDSGKETAVDLLRKVGIERLAHGGAAVYPEHPNIVMNSGTASVNDVFEVINKMHGKVKQQLGIDLELSLRLVGFPDGMTRLG